MQHKSLLFKLLFVCSGMFIFAFLLVPLYDVLCDVTGLNGKPSLTPAEAAKTEQHDENRSVKVSLLSHLQGPIQISIEPDPSRLDVQPGKHYQVNYMAHNTSDKIIDLRAIPSVSPGLAAAHLHKIECFCFEEQRILPGETKAMGLNFYIDSDLGDKIKEVTLSYAIFDITEPESTPLAAD
jgi:cytochrome c oxidase assembly protein subunit 11